jgi:hypothetical protein
MFWMQKSMGFNQIVAVLGAKETKVTTEATMMEILQMTLNKKGDT